MKTCYWLALFASGALASAVADPAPAKEKLTAWVDPADPTVAAIRQTGEQLINRVGHMLIFEVDRTIADKGVAKAVELMHLKDLTLPKPVPGQPRVTAIKRTSLALRNPANRPDIADQEALEVINTALKDGEDVPTLLIQRLALPNLPLEWRVYRPITAMTLCLKCHGPLDELNPEVRAYLAQKYPQDQAIGYRANQWRGVIRISLAAPEPAPAAKTK